MAFWNRRAEDAQPTQTVAPAAARSLGERDVRNLIDGCCARGANAVVLCSDVGATYNGRFIERRGDVVHIEMSSSEPPAIKMLSLCVVTFNQGTRARVFLTSLLGAESGKGGHRLLVQVPTEMAGAEGRFSFRVPLAHIEGLHVTVQSGSMKVDAHAIDVSLTGLQLEVPAGADLGVSLDDTVVVTLQYDGQHVVLDGTVRRIIGRRYGLFFAACVHPGGHVDPPEVLGNLVRELEQHWLRDQRAKVG